MTDRDRLDFNIGKLEGMASVLLERGHSAKTRERLAVALEDVVRDLSRLRPAINPQIAETTKQ